MDFLVNGDYYSELLDKKEKEAKYKEKRKPLVFNQFTENEVEKYKISEEDGERLMMELVEKYR